MLVRESAWITVGESFKEPKQQSVRYEVMKALLLSAIERGELHSSLLLQEDDEDAFLMSQDIETREGQMLALPEKWCLQLQLVSHSAF